MDLLKTVDPHVVGVALALMLLDVLLGLAGAVKDRDVQSSKMREGLWHKCGSVGLIVLAYVLELAAARLDLGIQVPAVAVVCAYVVLMEAGSCLENLVVLNPELRDNPVMRVFAHREENDQAGGDSPAEA